jgi:PAS domain S-box-containing protein
MSYRSTRGTPGEGKPFDTEVRFRRILAALCAVVVVVLAIGGGIYLSARRAQATSAAKEQLIAIADLKLRQIISWRAERLADAHFFSLARFAAQDVQRFLDNPGLAANRSAILHWLNLLKGDRYYAAMIIDPRMRCRLSIPDNVTEPVVSLQALLAGALKAHEPIMSDLHRDQANGFIHLDIAFPLFKNADPGSGAPIAMVLLKLDSRSFLFPLVRSWPTPSKTGETYLVSRKGDDVLYLSDLRDAPGMALSLRIPLKSPGLVAARVLQGETEPFEGWDFHGVPVVAVGRRVPGTDWAMIARVDRRELYGPLRRQLLAEALVLGGLLIISVLTVGLVWRRRNAQFFQRELSLEKERGTIADRLAHLMQNASDIILISDTEGRVIDANECALKSYGYNLGEIQQLNIKDLCAPDTMPGLKESANGTADDTTIFETIHRRKDGSAFPVEVSSRKISIGGESYRLCIVRDISERRRSEQHVRDLNFALGQRNAELDEERMHWRAALEGIADEVWI